MKIVSCATVMAALVVAVGLLVVHWVLAQSTAQSSLTPRLEPNVPQTSPSPQLIEQRPQIRHETVVDENGQPQTRVVEVFVPVGASQPADAETAELAAAEVQAAKEAQELVHQLQSVESEGTKTELKAKLRAALARQFESQQKQRTREIAGIEERLNKLKETLQKRDAAKDKIVDRRLDQLTGVKDELAWEETQGVGPVPHRDWAFPATPYSLAPPPISPIIRDGKKVPPLPTGTRNQSIQFPALQPGTSIVTPAPVTPPVQPNPATRLIPTNPNVPATAPAPVVPAAPATPATTPAPAAVPPSPAPPLGT